MEELEIDDIDLEEEVPEPRWKKPLILVIGIFLVLLMVSYSLVASDTLQGLLTSVVVKEDTLNSKNTTIIFLNNSLAVLQEEYIANQEREIKACLIGTTDGKVYNVNRIHFPKVLAASVIHIVTPGCPEDTIIDLHSHPVNRCIASAQDMLHFGQVKQEHLMMMVMCGPKRFSVSR